MLQVMDDLRAADVDFLTIGQYLQPTRKHHPVVALRHAGRVQGLRDDRLCQGLPDGLVEPADPLVASRRRGFRPAQGGPRRPPAGFLTGTRPQGQAACRRAVAAVSASRGNLASRSHRPMRIAHASQFLPPRPAQPGRHVRPRGRRGVATPEFVPLATDMQVRGRQHEGEGKRSLVADMTVGYKVDPRDLHQPRDAGPAGPARSWSNISTGRSATWRTAGPSGRWRGAPARSSSSSPTNSRAARSACSWAPCSTTPSAASLRVRGARRQRLRQRPRRRRCALIGFSCLR